MFRVGERGSGLNGHYQIVKADVDSFFSNKTMKNEVLEWFSWLLNSIRSAHAAD